MPDTTPRLLSYYRNTPARLSALQEENTDPYDSYLFMGADQLAEKQWQLLNNLEQQPGTIAHHLGVWSSQFLHKYGGYGGDFPSCLKNLRLANQSDLLWSTVDTLGIPLSILKKLKLIRKPLVYTSIGLPERLLSLPEGRLKTWQISALNTCNAIICFGWSEAEYLRAILKAPIHFMPYGVDTETWHPRKTTKTADVLSLGIDPQRDFAQLVTFARQHPEKTLRIITNDLHRASLNDLPHNVTVDDLIPLADIPQAMASAKVIALPVKENTYSGATTTLLQAMSMGLPVVVSHVGAIADGYNFAAPQSCITVPPNDPDALSQALATLLSQPEELTALGIRARKHCQQHFTWDQFINRIDHILRQALN